MTTAPHPFGATIDAWTDFTDDERLILKAALRVSDPASLTEACNSGDGAAVSRIFAANGQTDAVQAIERGVFPRLST